MKGKISEIFDSVQGEGIYLGEKQLFVRFFGCNLSCKYCDTPLKYFTEYEPDELIAELKLYHDEYHSVSFTGGEPLLQKNFLKEALTLCKKNGYRNYLETNGTCPDELADVIDLLDFIAMDIKLPSSTGQDDFSKRHYDFLRIASRKEVFLKMVICNTTTESDIRKSLDLIKLASPHSILILQPDSHEDHGSLNEKLESMKLICISENVTTCVIPQMHKIAGVK